MSKTLRIIIALIIGIILNSVFNLCTLHYQDWFKNTLFIITLFVISSITSFLILIFVGTTYSYLKRVLISCLIIFIASLIAGNFTDILVELFPSDSTDNYIYVPTPILLGMFFVPTFLLGIIRKDFFKKGKSNNSIVDGE